MKSRWSEQNFLSWKLTRKFNQLPDLIGMITVSDNKINLETCNTHGPHHSWPSRSTIGALFMSQVMTWTRTELMSTEPLTKVFSKIWIYTQWLLLKKMHLKLSAAKFQPFCSGLNRSNVKSYLYLNPLHNHNIDLLWTPTQSEYNIEKNYLKWRQQTVGHFVQVSMD